MARHRLTRPPVTGSAAPCSPWPPMLYLTVIHRWGWALTLRSDGTTVATSPDGKRTLHSVVGRPVMGRPATARPAERRRGPLPADVRRPGPRGLERSRAGWWHSSGPSTACGPASTGYVPGPPVMSDGGSHYERNLIIVRDTQPFMRL